MLQLILWMDWLWSWGYKGKTEADIALEKLAAWSSALFGIGTVYHT